MLWGLTGVLDIIELQNNFSLFAFGMDKDLHQARHGSPLTIAGQQLILTT